MTEEIGAGYCGTGPSFVASAPTAMRGESNVVAIRIQLGAEIPQSLKTSDRRRGESGCLMTVESAPIKLVDGPIQYDAYPPLCTRPRIALLHGGLEALRLVGTLCRYIWYYNGELVDSPLGVATLFPILLP